jgi:hypothetical protein
VNPPAFLSPASSFFRRSRVLPSKDGDTPQEERREEILVLDQAGETTTFIRDIVIP